MLAESQQGFLGHRVNCVGSGESTYIEDIGSLWVLCPGAGEQQPLGTRTAIGQPLPSIGFEHSPICRVSLLANGDAEPVPISLRDLLHCRLIPTTDEKRRH